MDLPGDSGGAAGAGHHSLPDLRRWRFQRLLLPAGTGALLRLVRLLTAVFVSGPIDWSQIPIEHPLVGVARQTLHGASQTLVRYVYQPGCVFPVHHHPEEQITIVLSGSIDFTVDGAPITLSTGECALIPAHTPHGAVVSASEVVVTLNTMSPRRTAAPDVGSRSEVDQ